MEFTEPTPIQGEIIPLVLSGADCLAQAPTGTGKTCAFGLPILDMIDTQMPNIQAIILCPTRELAMQIEAELKRLAQDMRGVRILSIYGGQNIERQLAGLRKKPQIIVGTTGRVMDHLRRHTLKINDTKIIVLDEADEMLNMGFREDIDTILAEMPKKVQTLLFSATMPKEILDISKSYQTEPKMVKTTCEGLDLPPITQYILKIKDANKYEALKTIIREEDFKTVLVFCNTKRKVDSLDEMLNEDNYLSMALHGDLRQRERDKVMRSFRQKAINILVATDIAARGIDVSDVEAIFNYDLPLDDEYYIHRIGRTARAKKSGVAYSFVADKDAHRVRDCERTTGEKMIPYTLKGLTEEKKGKKGSEGIYTKPSTRFFVNVGEKDGADRLALIEYVTSHCAIGSEEIFDVKIMDIFSFVEVDASVGDEMMSLNGEKCFKRKLAVEVSNGKTKSSGERKPYARTEGKESRPYSKSSGEKKSYAKSEGGERKPYAKSESGERKPYARSEGGERKPYARSEGGERKPYARSEDGERKPYARSEGGERKPYARSEGGERKPYARSEGGERKPYARSEGGERKPYARSESGERKPYARSESGERKPYARSESGERKPYVRSESGEKKSYSRSDGEGRTYSKPSGERKYAKRSTGSGERGNGGGYSAPKRTARPNN